MNLVFVFIFLLCVATVNAFMTAKSPGIPRGSHLFGKLHDAAEVGDLETVKEIIGGDPKLVSKYDIDGQLALHWAAKMGHFEMVQYLLEKGPGFINFKNIRFRTPLHWACTYAGAEGHESCEAISFLLVVNGADLNVPNKDNFTPLDYAKRGPLGKEYADRLKAAAEGVEVRPVDIGIDRVYWG